MLPRSKSPLAGRPEPDEPGGAFARRRPCRALARRHRPGGARGARQRGSPPARPDRAHRLGERHEPRGARGARARDGQQDARRLSRQPLPRRRRIRRCRRAPRDRARQGAVRRGLRERAAALRHPGEPGGVLRSAKPGRPYPEPRPGIGRAFEPRGGGEPVGALVRLPSLRRGPRDRPARLRRGRGARPRGAPRAAHRRRLGIPARDRLRTDGPHRRSGRGAPAGRHGAYRRPRGRRRTRLARAACRHRDLHHDQDAARAPRRRHPRALGRVRETPAVRRVPRSPGEPPLERAGRQGGVPGRGASPGVRGLRAAGGRECARARRRDRRPRHRDRRGRHGHPHGAARPLAGRAARPAGRDRARARRHHVEREPGAFRRAPALGVDGPSPRRRRGPRGAPPRRAGGARPPGRLRTRRRAGPCGIRRRAR